MKSLAIGLATAVVTFFATNMWARADRDEKYASLIFEKCPQLLLKTDNPEVALIRFQDGSHVPVRARYQILDGR
jgi:hypothetical protein